MKEGHWTVTFQRNPSWPTVRITRAEAINGPDFTIELTNLGSVLHNLRNREQLFPCKFHHCTSAIELDSTQNSVDMASIIRSKSVLSVLFINLFLSLVSSAVAVSSGYEYDFKTREQKLELLQALKLFIKDSACEFHSISWLLLIFFLAGLVMASASVAESNFPVCFIIFLFKFSFEQILLPLNWILRLIY